MANQQDIVLEKDQSSQLSAHSRRVQPPFSRWRLVIALGITTIISYGTTQYLFGVLIVPMSETFHWSRASLSGAYALSILITGILGVPVGAFLDRSGARLLMTIGSVLGGFSLIGLAFIHHLWQLYVFWAGGLGIAMTLILYPVTFTVVTNAFPQQRGKALALLTVLGGLASPLFLPLVGTLLPIIGWRETLVLCGLFHLLVAVPLHWLFLLPIPHRLEEPKQDGELQPSRTVPGVSTSQALRSTAFWMLTGAYSLATLGYMVVFAHQVAYLVDRHYDVTFAAIVAGLLGIISLPARFLLNILSERIAAHILLGWCMVLQASGIVVLILAPSVHWLMLYIVLYGIGFGAVSPLRASVMADRFGQRAYGTITAIQGVPVALCAAGGPLIAGWLFDMLGRYDLAFWLCAAGFLLATPGIFFSISTQRR